MPGSSLGRLRSAARGGLILPAARPSSPRAPLLSGPDPRSREKIDAEGRHKLWKTCGFHLFELDRALFRHGRLSISLNACVVNGRSAKEISTATLGPARPQKRRRTKTHPGFLGVFDNFSKSSCSESRTGPCIRPLGDTAGKPRAAHQIGELHLGRRRGKKFSKVVDNNDDRY